MAQYSWDFQQDTPGQPPQGWRVEEVHADNVSLSVAVSQGQTLLWETSNYTPPGAPGAAAVLEPETVSPTTTGEVEMVAIFRFLPGEPWGPEPEASMGIGLELWKDIDAESGAFAAVDLEIHNIWAEEPGYIHAGWWIEDDDSWDDADFEGLEPGTWYVLRHTVTTSSVAATLSEFESGQQIVSLAVPLTTLLEPDLHLLYAGQLDYESAAIEFQWIGIGTDGDPAPMPEAEPTELGGRSSTGTLAAASLDTQLSLSGRSASGARVEADVDTGVRLAGRSGTVTRAAAEVNSAIRLAGRSPTATRVDASVASRASLSGQSATPTRAQGAARTGVILSGRSAAAPRAHAALDATVEFGGRSATATRARGDLRVSDATRLSGRSATVTRAAGRLVVDMVPPIVEEGIAVITRLHAAGTAMVRTQEALASITRVQEREARI